MFSELFNAIQSNSLPDPDTLRKRFDFAMTKKMGILKLPPPFWIQDPKINPRVDHLFWAALLLKDKERIDMALSAVAAELQEKTCRRREGRENCTANEVRKMIEELLQQFSDNEARKQFILDLRTVVPEITRSYGIGNGNE